MKPEPCACGCGRLVRVARFPSQQAQFLKGHSTARPLAAQFWSHVNKDGTLPDPDVYGDIGFCWLWTGATDGRGYGALNNRRVSDKPLKAHRVAFCLETGRWPEPSALHRCDNTRCVRFSHLFEGTQTDNMRDAARKGRIVPPGQKERCR